MHRHRVSFYIDTSCIRRFLLVAVARAEGRSSQVAETDTNNDGIADFIQGRQSEEGAGLTVSTPAQEYFDKYFSAYRDALVEQRDDISKFERLPDVVTYPSATQTNDRLTVTAPADVVGVLNRYIAYLDEYKEQVDRAIKEIRELDQA